MFCRYIWSVLAFLLLPSCGGLGALIYAGEALYQRNTGPTNTDFGTDLAIPGLAMVNRVNALPATPSSSMPNGTYTYNGFAGFGYGSVSSLSELTRLSKMNMTANFQTNTFSGSMTKLTHETTNGTYDGTISMSGSISGNTFNGVHSGVWTMQSTKGYIERPYNGTVSGIFGGSGATGMLGETNSNFGGSAGYTGLLVGER